MTPVSLSRKAQVLTGVFKAHSTWCVFPLNLMASDYHLPSFCHSHTVAFGLLLHLPGVLSFLTFTRCASGLPKIHASFPAAL